MANRQRVSWLTDALLVAAFSAASSSAAFLYQAGYCSFFGIPKELIRVDIGSVVTCATAIGTVLWGAYSFLFQFVKNDDESIHPIWRNGLRTIGPAAMLVPILASPGWTNNVAALTLMGFFAAWITRPWIEPLLTHSDVQGYVEKLRATQKANVVHELPERSFVIGRKVFGYEHVGLVLVWVMIVCYQQGVSDAHSSTDFLVYDGKDLAVIVRFYGEVAVGLSLDQRSLTLGSDVVTIPISENQITFSRRKIVGWKLSTPADASVGGRARAVDGRSRGNAGGDGGVGNLPNVSGAQQPRVAAGNSAGAAGRR